MKNDLGPWSYQTIDIPELEDAEPEEDSLEYTVATQNLVDILPCTRAEGRLFYHDDRAFRQAVENARREGAPILSPNVLERRYRLAETDEEFERCFNSVVGRGYSLIITGRKMAKRWQTKGQMKIE